MWITFSKTTDPWEIFLPAFIFMMGIVSATHISNSQIRIACLITAVVGMARLLYVINVLSLLWWEYICYICLVAITVILCIVKLK